MATTSIMHQSINQSVNVIIVAYVIQATKWYRRIKGKGAFEMVWDWKRLRYSRY